MSSLYSLIGCLSKKKGFVALYSTLLWFHLGASIGSGAYFIYTLFHQEGDKDINSCISGSTDKLKQEVCKKSFDVLRGVLIGVFVVIWLIELCALLIFELLDLQ